MPVSGIVVRVQQSSQQQVKQLMEVMEGVELHPACTEELLVATLESTDYRQEHELTDRIQALEGVFSLSVAYHNFEDMVDA